MTMTKREMMEAFAGGDRSPVLAAVREVFNEFRLDLVHDVIVADKSEELWVIKGALTNLDNLERELKAQMEKANRTTGEGTDSE